jgi:hypothetical protein
MASHDEADEDEGGVLVRLPVGAGAWAEGLPPAPGGARVTVSLSSPALADEHGEALDLLGYLVVDGPAECDGPPVAWFVVDGGVAARHRRWWASVRSLADAVLPLAMGPVLRRYSVLLRAHGRLPGVTPRRR